MAQSQRNDVKLVWFGDDLEMQVTDLIAKSSDNIKAHAQFHDEIATSIESQIQQNERSSQLYNEYVDAATLRIKLDNQAGFTDAD
jgi:hypothetical protein